LADDFPLTIAKHSSFACPVEALLLVRTCAFAHKQKKAQVASTSVSGANVCFVVASSKLWSLTK
jgi:hypothetical protein